MADSLYFSGLPAIVYVNRFNNRLFAILQQGSPDQRPWRSRRWCRQTEVQGIGSGIFSRRRGRRTRSRICRSGEMAEAALEDPIIAERSFSTVCAPTSTYSGAVPGRPPNTVVPFPRRLCHVHVREWYQGNRDSWPGQPPIPDVVLSFEASMERGAEPRAQDAGGQLGRLVGLLQERVGLARGPGRRGAPAADGQAAAEARRRGRRLRRPAA